MYNKSMVSGRCILCQHKCGHIFMGHESMSPLVHECIGKLEGGCGHNKDNEKEICASCRDLTVTVLWQLAKGETLG